jgi:hypothetical protein
VTPERAVYWLLDAAALGWMPLEWLTADNVCEVFNTRRGHELSFPDLVDTLEGLFQSGDLIAERLEQNHLTGEFVPSRPDLVAGLSGQVWLYYGLTGQGGARWEAFARPDWSRYIDASYWTDTTDGDIEVGEIVAQDKHAVEQYLAALYAHYVNPTYTIHPDSEHWDLLIPWDVTYWKTLPQGYRVHFTYHDETDRDVVAQRLLVAYGRPAWPERIMTPANWYTRDW